jgi:hypothetical protein
MKMFRRDIVLVFQLLHLASCANSVASVFSSDNEISVSVTPTSHQIVSTGRFWSIWTSRKSTVVSPSRSSTVSNVARKRQPTIGDKQSSQIGADGGAPGNVNQLPVATSNDTIGDEKIAVTGDEQTSTDKTGTVSEEDIVTTTEKVNTTTSGEDIVSTTEVIITTATEEIGPSINSTTVVPNGVPATAQKRFRSQRRT